MNVLEYRELKKKKLRKYRNIKVEACPECWMELKKDKNSERRNCYDCRMSFCPGQFVLFDSKAEWEHGLMLKKREKRGEIGGLRRQTRLCRKIKNKYDSNGFQAWEEFYFRIDFTFFDRIEKKYCLHEVKCLNKKTGKPYIQGTLKEFRNRCQKAKMTCIGYPDVQVFAGGREFRFDEKGKLKEVL